MEQAFAMLELPRTLEVRRLISFFYFEFAKDFIFPGERHDFWELIYIDRGEVDIAADERRLRLSRGQIYFHKPNQFHAIYANRVVAPNLCVIAFDCPDEAMYALEDALITLSGEQQSLMSQILREGMDCFEPPLNDYANPCLRLRRDAPYAAGQVLRNLLELFFLQLIRSREQPKTGKVPCIFTENHHKALTDAAIACMKENLHGSISIPELCRELSISKTSLSVAFRSVTGCSLIDYFTRLKIEEAKKCIREENQNFTQIAQQLGFGSVHYFSRRFRMVTSMSPSEYARSIRAKAGR